MRNGQRLVRVSHPIFPVVGGYRRTAPRGSRVTCACGAHWWRDYDRMRFPRPVWRASRSAGCSRNAGRLEEAQNSSESSLSPRPRRLPGRPGQPSSGCSRSRRYERRAWRPSRGQGSARRGAGILDDNPDAGIFPELLDSQERKLRSRRPREGQLNGGAHRARARRTSPARQRVLYQAYGTEPLRRPKHRKNPGQIHLP